MFQRLVSHNGDLERLVDKGYAVAFDPTNHLVVRDIPYLDEQGAARTGALVAILVPLDQERVGQSDHQVFFAGSHPYQLDGTPIPNLGGGAHAITLSDKCSDVVVQRSFSNKPKVNGAMIAGFDDFFVKIEHYVGIVSGPAMARYGVTPLTGRSVDDDSVDPIFKFSDALTGKSGIGDLASKLEDEVVAIIGLGGTGSYVLDFVVKSRVKEIRGFDGDKFHIHNAFRSPGHTDPAEFDRFKTEVFRDRYENFRNGIALKNIFVDSTSSAEFEGVTFAFVCVDKGSSRKQIFDLLTGLGIPFVDVGMGLNKKMLGLSGSIRVTEFLPETAAAVRAQRHATEVDEPENVYRSNIQIAELNALNAALAVIKFKQLRGFYRADLPAAHHIFSVADMKTFEVARP